MMIPGRALILSGSFGGILDAGAVARAIGRGVSAAGLEEPDLCPLDQAGADARGMLDSLDFDARMRPARAVIVADVLLAAHTLAGGPSFEAATRARQAGVPAYAVAAENRLSLFDARILDLQLILLAQSEEALSAAGEELARVM